MDILPFAGSGLHADDPLMPLPASWECDLVTEEIRWSPGVYDLFGLPRGAPITRDQALAMYSAESRLQLTALRANAVASAGSFTFDAQIRRPDGSWRWMRLTADVECRNGRPVRLYGTKQDITEEMAHLPQGGER